MSSSDDNFDLELIFGDDYNDILDLPVDEPLSISLDFGGFQALLNNSFLDNEPIEPVELIEPVVPAEPLADQLPPPPPLPTLAERLASLESQLAVINAAPPPSNPIQPTPFRRVTKAEKDNVFEAYQRKRVLHHHRSVVVYYCKTRIEGREYHVQMLGSEMTAAKFPRADQAKKEFLASEKVKGKKRF
jgi:hypothetical protein